ncbi:transporter substrate-binding domain-containing protein [Variovorax sp. PBL-E5]|uniref:transporter substrate-binding domain-containing protein n=1 Tax=Variovorax sp. PBL-E5 TaxID=434014 RepID=UPI001315ED75|nr:transporter substrate-binding domain-containing protein [Variovorax sp. PBL-E5]VTU45482.1 Octopine-binding periplasmic protein precursor [Variovorax sp. PBL-E5]
MIFPKPVPEIGRRSLCAFLMAAGLACVAHAQPGTYRIATEGTYPPWSFKDAQGQLQGWDVDIAHALCEKMQARCEIVAQDWDGIIPGLVARKFDLIVASMAITEQRRQRVDFSDKYKETISRFVAKKGTPADVSPAASTTSSAT